MLPQENPHWFDNLFDSVYQFSLILDKNGRVLKANKAILKTTALSPSDITGVFLWKLPWAILTGQNRRSLKQAIKQASKGNFVHSQLDVQQDGRTKLILDFSLKPIYDDHEQIEFILFEGQDVTKQKRTREALFESRARFQTIFEESGIGIVIKNMDGGILDANPAFQNLLGYTVRELKQLSYLDVTHAEDRSASKALFNELINGKQKSYITEKRYLHKDGQVIWANVTSSAVYGPDGQIQFVIAMVENISMQKQIEIELSELRHRLMYGREMERLRIAQDLHDGPLQEVIGISYQLQALENSIASSTDTEQLQAIQISLNQLAKTMRVICGELRPPTLIPFGLEKTILSHAEEIRTTHPELEVILDLTADGQILAEKQRIVLFRIYQEAFHNLLRHSQASKVWVHFWVKEGLAILEIHDNGVGFEPPKRWIEFARQGHLGLVGAMERAKEANGSLSIKSGRNQGTLIRVTVPITEEGNQTNMQ